MRNLKLCSHGRYDIANGKGKLCFNEISGSVIVVNEEFILQQKSAEDEFECILSWSERGNEMSEIISAEFTIDSNVCVVTSKGLIVNYDIENDAVEVVGDVPSGITSATWSPDLELLSLVTGNSSLIIMTVSFNPIAESNLTDSEFGQGEFVNVGWGKKETQFHGSEGKTAAKQRQNVTEGVTKWDDLKPRISWRGDGQLFAVSFVTDEQVQKRRFKVFDREGILQYTNEPVNGLESGLSWRPSGNTIAASQRLTNKHCIVFFEKNGLKHGEFTLPLQPDEEVVKEITWNQDSTVMLILLQNIDTKLTSFQLWTTGNYHWYLKQHYHIDTIQHLIWSGISALSLTVLSLKTIQIFRWASIVCHSSGNSLTDTGQVSVIDGKKLMVTPFRQTVVPPPLAAYEIQFTDSIHEVLYPPSCVVESNSGNSESVEDSGFLETVEQPGKNSNNICIFYGADYASFFIQAQPNEPHNNVHITAAGGAGFSTSIKIHTELTQARIILGSSFEEKYSKENFHSWTWITPTLFLSCYSHQFSNKIYLFELEGLGNDQCFLTAKKCLQIHSRVERVALSPSSTYVCLYLSDHSVVRFVISDFTIEPWTINGIDFSIPDVTNDLQVCHLDCGDYSLGLTDRNHLYLGNICLLTNCTSFFIHTEHLLVTTLSHKLLIVPLNMKAMRKFQHDGNKDIFSDIGRRRLERGSRLVIAVPKDTKVLLQMPRGNLEMIHPRMLIVHHLKNLLDSHQYHNAVEIMRKHRLDLNLIYDHNPQQFIINVDVFVKSVSNANWIDLFIATLSDTDVTQSLYASNYTPRNKASNNIKVREVCDAIRSSLLSIDADKYLLPILTSYVKSKDEMEMTLKFLQNVKDDKERILDEGLRHLMYMTDVNELCDVAMGTYDFDLVMMVFEKSQKDPKEYLPFLNDLNKLEENYKRFRIDVYLKRYKKAMKHLKGMNQHRDEVLELIKNEQLYNESLEVFKHDTNMYDKCCELFGDFLREKNFPKEAAVMYMRTGIYEKAIGEYEKAENWQQMLTCAHHLHMDPQEMDKLHFKIVQMLKSRGNFVDAAFVYEFYRNDVSSAIECLLEGHLWEKVLLISAKHKESNRIMNRLKPAVEEAFAYTINQISDFSLEFQCQSKRLLEVRQKKEAEMIDGCEDGQLDCDLYCDSSTTTGYSKGTSSKFSSSSTKTYRSTKNKRKLERKKYSTKEGSPFEDLGLITNLHEIIIKIDVLAGPVRQLLEILILTGEESKACVLQGDLERLYNVVDKSSRDIWPPEKTDDEFHYFGPEITAENAIKQMAADDRPNSRSFTSNRMILLEPQFRFPPKVTRGNWKMFMLK